MEYLNFHDFCYSVMEFEEFQDFLYILGLNNKSLLLMQRFLPVSSKLGPTKEPTLKGSNLKRFQSSEAPIPLIFQVRALTRSNLQVIFV